MEHYDLRLLGDDGHIKAREILLASDDTEAQIRAEYYLRAHESVPIVELWRGERRIKAFKQAAVAQHLE